MPNAVSYLWSTGSTDSVITVEYGGTYTVEIAVPNCFIYDTLHLAELPSPIPVLEDAWLCPEDSALFNASSPNCTYLWNTGNVDSTQYGRPVNVYTVLITNEVDCYIVDTAIAFLKATCPELYVPNSFTPDGDGINETFRPVYYQLQLTEFLIFDRWGGIVYENYGPYPEWDGTVKGRETKIDVYNWKLSYNTLDGISHVAFGTVTLVR